MMQDTLRETNISHLGERKKHLQICLIRGYVNSLEGIFQGNRRCPFKITLSLLITHCNLTVGRLLNPEKSNMDIQDCDI